MERWTHPISFRLCLAVVLLPSLLLFIVLPATAQVRPGLQEVPYTPGAIASPDAVGQAVNWATVVEGGNCLAEAPPPVLPLEITPKPPLPPEDPVPAQGLREGDVVSLTPPEQSPVALFRTIRTNAWYPKVSLGENATYYAVMEYDAGAYNGFTVYKNNGDPSVTAWTFVVSVNNANHDFDFEDIEIVSSADRGFVIFHRYDLFGNIDCFWWQLSNPSNSGIANVGGIGQNYTNPYCSITSDEIEYNGSVYLYACYRMSTAMMYTRSTNLGLNWGGVYEWVNIAPVTYMMTGNAITYCPGNNHVFISLTTSNANVVVLQSAGWGVGPWTWSTVISGGGVPFTSGGIVASYGDYILASAFGQYPAGPENNLVYSVSSNGGTSWSPIQAVGGNGDQNYPSCAASKDGYVSMMYYDWSEGQQHMKSMRATYLNQVWSVYNVDPNMGYNTVSSACIEDGATLPDHGGAWSSGIVTNPSYFGWGSLPLSVTIIPHNPPVTIPANGGNFTYDIYVHNNDVVAKTFDVWALGTKPNGDETPVKWGPVNQTLQPGQVYSALNIVQGAPSFVPAGTYNWIAKIGTYPNLVTDSDRFPVVKLAVAGDNPWASAMLDCADPFAAPQPDQAMQPESHTLFDAQPNPFNPTTDIRYKIQDASQIRLRVYDAAGRLVATLVDGWREAGEHRLTFNGSELPSGVYLARLETGDYSAVQKLVLMK